MMTSEPYLFGGEKIRNKKFPKRKTMGEEEIEAVTDVMRSDNLSSFLGAPGKHFLGGEKVLQFEEEWKIKFGFKHAISVNSWTSGLIICVGAIGIEPGDEVICSPYSMSASATSVLFYGGIPVFADIDPKTCNLDPTSIESKITPRTKAILVVHIFGQSADMDAIIKIAKKYKIKIIEDGAQSPGVYYNNKPVGAIGDIGGFSFNYHKHIHTGEGGLIVTNDDELAFRCQLIRNHGENYSELLDEKLLVNLIGGNYRLTELQAAIGIGQLKKLDGILEHRRKMANYLFDAIIEIKGLLTYKPQNDQNHAYYVFPFLFEKESFKLNREEFVYAVNSELPESDGWETTPLASGYVQPLYWNKIYQRRIAIGSKGYPFHLNNSKNNYIIGECPVTESMYTQKLILTPLIREGINYNDLKDFINAIKKVVNNQSKLREYFDLNPIETKAMTPVEIANEKNIK